MVGDYSWFSSFTKVKNDGNVSFKDNPKGKIVSIGNIGKKIPLLLLSMYV